MASEVLSLILGGGRGTRLFPLTMLRSKPAVPIAGKYRLIDIPISNCINSGFNRVYVLTQFLSVSLHRHISNTYKFDPFSRGFVEILAAQQTNEKSDWYQGTADAVRQNIRYVHDDPCQDILILSGDQVYRMDFKQLLETHRRTRAQVTIAVLPVNAANASGFGILRVNDEGEVLGFVEKPQTPEQLAPVTMSEEWIEQRGIHAKGRQYLASMGIYLFQRDALFKMLNAPPLATDFGKEVFPNSLKDPNIKVQTHLFDGYWEDVGTIKSYHEASLALCEANSPFDFHAPEGVIYTRMRYLPAAQVHGANLDSVLLSDGCRIGHGTTITRTVVGVRMQIGKNVTLKNTVLIGADQFDSTAEKEENARRSLPNLGIGDGCYIENAIIDKNARIGNNVRILNQNKVQDAEGPNYVIRDGLVVIPKDEIILDGTVI